MNHSPEIQCLRSDIEQQVGLDDTIALSDTKILISSNWPTTNNGKPAVFMNLLSKAKELGYLIVPC